jgi:hypothetical protein
VHVLDDVVAVDVQDTARITQRGMEYRTIFGGVDVHAGEHRIAALLESRGAGRVDEQTAAFPGSPAGPAGSLPDRIPATSDKD